MVLLNLAMGSVEKFMESGVRNISDQLEGNINILSRQIQKNVDNIGEQIDSQFKNLVPKKPGNLIEKELYRAVDHPISADRQEKIIKSIRVLVKRLQPFVKEVSPLFSETD